MKGTDTPAGWIFFDNSCGFCRRGVKIWRSILERRGFLAVPLQDKLAWEKTGASEEELKREMYLVLADGSIHMGADAYRAAMSRIGWAWPVYLISLVPGFRQLFNAAYGIIARNRQKISRACNLDL